MASLTQPINLFESIGARHPFGTQVAMFRKLINSHPDVDLWQELITRGEATIHTEVKGLPRSGPWELDRFYWSIQWRDASGQFQAQTLNYAQRKSQLEWLAFPHDSYLTTMAGVVAAQRGALDVLRYIPLRRFTFRASDPSTGQPLIGKVKRRSRFHDAHTRLETVSEALARNPRRFRVAAPLSVDPLHCVAYQEALPGATLTDAVDIATCPALFSQLGALHHDLHTLPVRDVPMWSASELLASLAHDIAWLRMFWPDQAHALNQIEQGMRECQPDLDAQSGAFCHGDFACSQLLVSPAGWSVLDFDLCTIGDPLWDMALLLSSLATDVPLFQSHPELLSSARAAYLRGYQAEAAHPIDAGRLAWLRAYADLTYLARALKKDWPQQMPPAVALAAVEGLIEEARASAPSERPLQGAVSYDA
jgi:aminoglycoside phosphotransferase (APT) family kinase protein